MRTSNFSTAYGRGYWAAILGRPGPNEQHTLIWKLRYVIRCISRFQVTSVALPQSAKLYALLGTCDPRP